jgi:hypothetical protein
MRKSLLLAILVALGVTGIAYAAPTVTHYYVVKAKIKPIKSGTNKHPVAIASTISYKVTPPANTRPKVVKVYDITVQGVRENTNKFPACGTARLLDPTQGPVTCPKGSLVATGFFNVAIGPSSSTSITTTCRADLSIYNGGSHNLSYYVFKGPEKNACPVTNGHDAFNAGLKTSRKGLVQTFTVPEELRHPASGFDSAATFATVISPKHVTKVKGHKVGLFESISCPANHERQVKVKFTREDGTFKIATRLVPCT